MLSDLYLHLNNDDKAIDILEEGSKYSDDSKLHNTLARLRNNNTVELSPTVNTTNDGEFNTNDICVVKAGKTDVKIRERPVNGSEVAKVNGGKLVQIISSQEGTDGYTWYEVTFDTDDGNIRGYIRSDFIDKTDYIRIEEYPEGTYLD